MSRNQKTPHIPLPKGWTKHVRSAVLHVLSLAQYAAVYTRGWAADSTNTRVRLKAELDRANQELLLLREESRIKDTRLARIDPHRRPHYPPTERMAILALKATRGWSLEQTARVLHVTAATIASWMKRVDEQGPDALVQLREPVNKFPDFVRFAVFAHEPTSIQVRAFLGRAIRAAGRAPKHLISDKGSQFWCDAFKAWCRRRNIKPRFGAVGRHGSIAVVERLILTMKQILRQLPLIPLRRESFRREMAAITEWYNQHRPHVTLGGRTPNEVYGASFPANRTPRIEPRPGWPRGSPCAKPWALVEGNPGRRFHATVTFHARRRHLPVVTLKRAA